LLQGLGIVALVGVVLFSWIGANLERFLNRTEPTVLPGVSERAQHLHDSAIVVDLHADSTLFGRDLNLRSDVGHVDFPRLREGGVAIQMFTAPTRTPFGFDIDRTRADGIDFTTLGQFAARSPMATMGPLDRALHQARRLTEFAAAAGGSVVPIRTRGDLDRVLTARAGGTPVLGVLFGIEGAHALEGDLDNLELLRGAGVRMVGITHFFDNAFAGSAHGVEKGGLTALGRELVPRLEAAGIAIDLSHLSPAAIDDVLAIATRPLIVSHTGVKGTCDRPRNLSDRHVQSIAAGGGVLGIAYIELTACGIAPADIVASMKYVIDLVGDDHVALGSDFDGATTTAFDTSRLPVLTQQMLDDGLSEATIRKVLGANAIRVLRETLPRD
jgi:microsomal dipeptidase-like Zn-dependent dipeptidase